MISLQHYVLYMMAALEHCSSNGEFVERLEKGIPWFILPRVIQYYIKVRQASRFEETPDKKDIAWMEFPTSSCLHELDSGSAQKVIQYHCDLKKYPSCVIGEPIHVEVFDKYNYMHNAYHYLRMYLLQENIQDEVLRNMLVDVEGRFNDRFVILNSKEVVNGTQLLEEIRRFERWGFLHLAGNAYKKTGILVNQRWFDVNVKEVLMNSFYPKDLAKDAIRTLELPIEIEQRINDFEFGTEESIFGLSGEELISVWNELFAKAYLSTYHEM